MSSVNIAGDTSGLITLQAPAVSGSTVLTLPTTTGTLVVNSGAQTIEFADGSASAPSITNSGDTNTGMFFPAADTIAFAEGGAESMRIDASGNLGLGVTPSATGSGYKSIEVAFAGNGLTSRSTGTLDINQGVYWAGGSAPIYSQTGVAAGHYRVSAGTHSWFTAPSGTAGNAITFTQVLAVEKDKSLALQGATSQTGAGITFPVTQSASTNANTLDDYEEGTWTPTLISGGCTGTAYYTKIGRQVTINGIIAWASNGAGSTGVTINNLPFTALNRTEGWSGWAGMALDGGDTQTGCVLNASGNTLILVGYPSGSGVDASRWVTGASFLFNVTYITA